MSSGYKLYPPIIGDSIPAFYEENGTAVIAVPFSVNRAVDVNDVVGLKIKIKTVQSNVFLETLEVVDPHAAQSMINNRIARFEWSCTSQSFSKIAIGQFVKIQIAFLSASEESSSGVITGYFSNVGIAKFTAKPDVYILNGEASNPNGTALFKMNYVGVYNTQGDVSERPYSYCFTLYDTERNVVESSGWLLHNSSVTYTVSESLSVDSVIDTYSFTTTLIPNEVYYVQYSVRTINNLEVHSPVYSCVDIPVGMPTIKTVLKAENNFDEGYISVKFAMPRYKYLTALSEISDSEDYQYWGSYQSFANSSTQVVPKNSFYSTDYASKHIQIISTEYYDESVIKNTLRNNKFPWMSTVTQLTDFYYFIKSFKIIPAFANSLQYLNMNFYQGMKLPQEAYQAFLDAGVDEEELNGCVNVLNNNTVTNATTLQSLANNAIQDLMEKEIRLKDYQIHLNSLAQYLEEYMSDDVAKDEILPNPVSVSIERADSTENFENWQVIEQKYFTTYTEIIDDWHFMDFTVEQGIYYKYSFRQFNVAGVTTQRDKANFNTAIMADFEDMFLYGGGNKQLKIRFNPKVSSFKSTQLEQKIETLGSRYPFIFKNGVVDYKEFPISGLISYNSDMAQLFVDYKNDLGITIGNDIVRESTPGFKTLNKDKMKKDALNNYVFQQSGYFRDLEQLNTNYTKGQEIYTYLIDNLSEDIPNASNIVENVYTQGSGQFNNSEYSQVVNYINSYVYALSAARDADLTTLTLEKANNLQEIASEYTSQRDALNAQIAPYSSIYSSDINQLQNRLTLLTTQLEASLEAQDNNYTSRVNSINSNFDTLVNGWQSNISDLEDEFATTTTSYNNSIKTAALNTWLTNEKDVMKESLSDQTSIKNIELITTINSLLNEKTAALTSAATQKTNKIASVTTDYNTQKANLEEGLSEYHSSYSSAINNLNSQIQDADSAYTSALNTLNENYDSQILSINATYNPGIEAKQNEINTLNSDFVTTTRTYQNAISSSALNTWLNNEKASMKNDLSDQSIIEEIEVVEIVSGDYYTINGWHTILNNQFYEAYYNELDRVDSDSLTSSAYTSFKNDFVNRFIANNKDWIINAKKLELGEAYTSAQEEYESTKSVLEKDLQTQIQHKNNELQVAKDAYDRNYIDLYSSYTAEAQNRARQLANLQQLDYSAQQQHEQEQHVIHNQLQALDDWKIAEISRIENDYNRTVEEISNDYDNQIHLVEEQIESGNDDLLLSDFNSVSTWYNILNNKFYDAYYAKLNQQNQYSARLTDEAYTTFVNSFVNSFTTTYKSQILQTKKNELKLAYLQSKAEYELSRNTYEQFIESLEQDRASQLNQALYTRDANKNNLQSQYAIDANEVNRELRELKRLDDVARSAYNLEQQELQNKLKALDEWKTIENRKISDQYQKDIQQINNAFNIQDARFVEVKNKAEQMRYEGLITDTAYAYQKALIDLSLESIKQTYNEELRRISSLKEPDNSELNDYFDNLINTYSTTNYNMRAERIFKLKVLEWLNDGNIKLFKSPAEGNYLVRLMNVSLTPEDKLGRMLHNFTAQACEIEELTFTNLKSLGFVAGGNGSGLEEQILTIESVNVYDKFIKPLNSKPNASFSINGENQIIDYLIFEPTENTETINGIDFRIGGNSSANRVLVLTHAGLDLSVNNAILPNVYFNIQDNIDNMNDNQPTFDGDQGSNIISDDTSWPVLKNALKTLLSDIVVTYGYYSKDNRVGLLGNIANIYIQNKIQTHIGPWSKSISVDINIPIEGTGTLEQVLKYIVLDFYEKQVINLTYDSSAGKYYDSNHQSMPSSRWDPLCVYRIMRYTSDRSHTTDTEPEPGAHYYQLVMQNDIPYYEEVSNLVGVNLSNYYRWGNSVDQLYSSAGSGFSSIRATGIDTSVTMTLSDGSTVTTQKPPVILNLNNQYSYISIGNGIYLQSAYQARIVEYSNS